MCPWVCGCHILYESIFNVFNSTTLFYVAELVSAKKNVRLTVMIVTDSKVL